MIMYFIERITDTYIKNDYGIEIYTKKTKYLNYLAKKNLINLKEYKKLVRANKLLKSNIPIQINDNTILFEIKKEYEVLYINYYSILSIGYKYDKIMILFKNGEYLLMNDIDYKVIKKSFSKIDVLINYKKELLS